MVALRSQAVLLCFKCIVQDIYRYQKENPNEILLKIETNVEGPEFAQRLQDMIGQATNQYSVPDGVVADLADGIMGLFDFNDPEKYLK